MGLVVPPADTGRHDASVVREQRRGGGPRVGLLQQRLADEHRPDPSRLEPADIPTGADPALGDERAALGKT